MGCGNDRHTRCPGAHRAPELIRIKGHNFSNAIHHNGEAGERQDKNRINETDAQLASYTSATESLFKRSLAS
jgi:hypothetical protein